MYTSNPSLTTLAAGCSAAAFLFLATLISSGDLRAEGRILETAPGAGEVSAPQSPESDFPLVRPRQDPSDEVAALEAVEIALTQAGDGATYVWQRGQGRIGGAVRMTSTFRDVDGRICRHLVMQIRQGTYSRRTEGIACRGEDGVWVLEG
jgi:hypothetical protein